jgi:predicted RNA-binding Zn-ribbon protein involved in translation (DUF1610 family)
MGLYDTLELPAALVLPGLDRDPSSIRWQTKSIGRPAMRTFRITPDGRLLEEEFHTEEVPEAERPYYGTDRWDEPFFRMAGAVRHVHDGWMERPYHGVIRFTASVDEALLAYEAKFTDGRLAALRDASGDDGEWLPIDSLGLSEATGSGARRAGADTRDLEHERPEGDDMPAYKRTATRSLTDTAEVYDVTIPDERVTQTRQETPYIQVLHLPDAGNRRNEPAEAPTPPDPAYELTVRAPVTVEDHDGSPRPVSAVLEREGPFDVESALRRAVELADSRGLPILHDIVTLRPNHWTETSMWVSCPDCGGDELTLVTDLDGRDLTIACRACDGRVTEAERETMFHEWFHCPSCESGDVNVELSAPSGGVWWSCDDCGYDSVPGSIDRGYTNARDGGCPSE